MILKYDGVCHVCNAPINPSIQTVGLFESVVVEYGLYELPIYTGGNKLFYNFFGDTLHKFCKSCFVGYHHGIKFSRRNIECGVSRTRVGRVIPSLTLEALTMRCRYYIPGTP